MIDVNSETFFGALVGGAGFSGLYQLDVLSDDLGLKVLAFEKGNGVGGTRFWNRYPGDRCDSENYSYAYFFRKKLMKVGISLKGIHATERFESF